MKNYLKTALVILFGCFFAWILWQLLEHKNIPILHAKGPIAEQERDLIILATVLMLAVVLPVFVLTALISWRYRATNTKAKYLPNWEHSAVEEFIWWGIPCFIVLTLAVFAMRTSVELDPFRPISGDALHIQAVALNWKWLFIYPEEGIASVNFVEFPANRPVEFDITSDAPMNSFWIPQLGGQIYAMTGMATKLSLLAAEPGTYYGSSANLSGVGFSGMHFSVSAVSEEDYEKWIADTKAVPQELDKESYEALEKPSANEPVRYYGSVEQNLFDSIVDKYRESMPMLGEHEMGHAL